MPFSLRIARFQAKGDHPGREPLRKRGGRYRGWVVGASRGGISLHVIANLLRWRGDPMPQLSIDTRINVTDLWQ